MGGGGGGGGGSYLCSTPSSDDCVECVFAFPAGARAIGRVGVHAGSMPPASPTMIHVSNAIVASRLVRVRNPQRLTRTDVRYDCTIVSCKHFITGTRIQERRKEKRGSPSLAPWAHIKAHIRILTSNILILNICMQKKLRQ